MRFTLILCTALFLPSAIAQSTAYETLTNAYQALKAGAYEEAIAGFDKTLAATPNRADVHKDAAYTCLKIGQNRAAREHFRAAMVLDATDLPAALEYAFLSFEATDDPLTAKAEARRVFDRVRRQTTNREAAATAGKAFRNIDTPLGNRHRPLVRRPPGRPAHLQRPLRTGPAGRAAR